MRIPPALLVHTVRVQPLLGRSSNGPVHGPAVELRCMAQGKRRMVRGTDGTETLSTLTLFCAPGESAGVPVGSLVTWRGDTTSVVATIEHDDGGLGAPQHCEVACE